MMTGGKIKFPADIRDRARKEIELEKKEQEAAVGDLTGDIYKIPWGIIGMLLIVTIAYSYAGRLVSMGPVVPIFNVVFFLFMGVQMCMRLR